MISIEDIAGMSVRGEGECSSGGLGFVFSVNDPDRDYVLVHSEAASCVCERCHILSSSFSCDRYL